MLVKFARIHSVRRHVSSGTLRSSCWQVETLGTDVYRGCAHWLAASLICQDVHMLVTSACNSMISFLSSVKMSSCTLNDIVMGTQISRMLYFRNGNFGGLYNFAKVSVAEEFCHIESNVKLDRGITYCHGTGGDCRSYRHTVANVPLLWLLKATPERVLHCPSRVVWHRSTRQP